MLQQLNEDEESSKVVLKMDLLTTKVMINIEDDKGIQIGDTVSLNKLTAMCT